MVLSRDLLYPAIFITSSFDFFSVHDILIIFLMYHISAATSLLSKFFCRCPASTSIRRDGPYVGFQSVDFGVNSDMFLVNMDFILVKVSSDKAIFYFFIY